MTEDPPKRWKTHRTRRELIFVIAFPFVLWVLWYLAHIIYFRPAAEGILAQGFDEGDAPPQIDRLWLNPLTGKVSAREVRISHSSDAGGQHLIVLRRPMLRISMRSLVRGEFQVSAIGADALEVTFHWPEDGQMASPSPEASAEAEDTTSEERSSGSRERRARQEPPWGDRMPTMHVETIMLAFRDARSEPQTETVFRSTGARLDLVDGYQVRAEELIWTHEADHEQATAALLRALTLDFNPSFTMTGISAQSVEIPLLTGNDPAARSSRFVAEFTDAAFPRGEKSRRRDQGVGLFMEAIGAGRTRDSRREGEPEWIRLNLPTIRFLADSHEQDTNIQLTSAPSPNGGWRMKLSGDRIEGTIDFDPNGRTWHSKLELREVSVPALLRPLVREMDSALVIESAKLSGSVITAYSEEGLRGEGLLSAHDVVIHPDRRPFAERMRRPHPLAPLASILEAAARGAIEGDGLRWSFHSRPDGEPDLLPVLSEHFRAMQGAANPASEPAEASPDPFGI